MPKKKAGTKRNVGKVQSLSVQKPRFYFIYLLIVFVYAAIGLLDSLLTFTAVARGTAYYLALSILAFAFFLYNAWMLLQLKKHGLQPITKVLPVYYVILYIAFFLWGFAAPSFGITTEQQTLPLAIFSFATSLFEAGFGAYVMKKIGYV